MILFWQVDMMIWQVMAEKRHHTGTCNNNDELPAFDWIHFIFFFKKIVCLSICLPFLLISMLNSFQYYKYFIWVNRWSFIRSNIISTNIISVLSPYFVWLCNFSLPGLILLNTALQKFLVLRINLFYCKKSNIHRLKKWNEQFKYKKLKLKQKIEFVFNDSNYKVSILNIF